MSRDAFTRLTAQRGMLFGGDYNPEQWDRATWTEDVRLMREAGVNLVTVGVFSWAHLEPRPGEYAFEWLAEVLDLLHSGGIAVDLATPTASPPPWLGHRHPETLPVTADGVTLSYGSRNQFTASSPVFREHALAITRALVQRFSTHPAVAMWHVGNELGQIDYSDAAATAFREWLTTRYGSIAALNEAWATTVWAQGYSTFGEILPPRSAPYHRNPAQELDFRRFTSDELLSLYLAQKAVIREFDEERPVTTNLMGFSYLADYRTWAGDLDVIADDAYPDPTASLADAALTQDLMRSLGGGRPWMLMESATSAVSWRPHNVTKSPARSRFESLQAVARGADGICFFQWRQARSGPERFHSAMLPLAGEDTDVHRGVRRLGADLARLGTITGSPVPARVALLWDWPSWWAASGESLPTDRLDPFAVLRDWYRPLWQANVTADVVSPDDDLAAYAVVIAPSLYLVDSARAAHLSRYVRGGGTLVVGPFSGVAQPTSTLHVGRFPVPLTGLLGVSGEEWVPLPDAGVPARWLGRDEGSPVFRVHGYAEHTRSDGAEVLVALGAGAGSAEEDVPGIHQLGDAVAVSRHRAGDGAAWYVGAELPPAVLGEVLSLVLAGAGVSPSIAHAPPGIEAVRRGDALFVFNHASEAAPIAGADLARALGLGPGTTLTDLLSGASLDTHPRAAPHRVAAHDVVVLKEER